MNSGKNGTREQPEKQYQEIHPKFQNDWSGIHMDNKKHLTFWQSMLALPLMIGCGCISGFGIVAFFATGMYRYLIPIFVIGCWIFAILYWIVSISVKPKK